MSFYVGKIDIFLEILRTIKLKNHVLNKGESVKSEKDRSKH